MFPLSYEIRVQNYLDVFKAKHGLEAILVRLFAVSIAMCPFLLHYSSNLDRFSQLVLQDFRYTEGIDLYII